MKLSALIRGLAELALAKTLTPERHQLKVGDRLDGKVLAMLPEDKVRIDFGRFRVLAEVRFPVQVGDRLPVEVRATGRQLQLRLLTHGGSHVAVAGGANAGSGTGAAGTVERHLAFSGRVERPEPENLPRLRADINRLLASDQTTPAADRRLPAPVARALAAVAAHFQPLNPAVPDSDLLAQGLKTFFENSGPFFEARLEKAIQASLIDQDALRKGAFRDLPLKEAPTLKALFQQDLKPNLLVLREHLEATAQPAEGRDPAAPAREPAAPGLKALQQGVASLLEGIEKQQDDALQRLRDAEPLVILQQPLPLPETGMKADLRLSGLRRGQAGDQESQRLSLLLEMSRIGDLRTDLFLDGRNLAVTFFVADEKARHLLERALPELETPLAGFFDTLGIRVLISRDKIAAMRSEEDPTAGDGVNLRV